MENDHFDKHGLIKLSYLQQRGFFPGMVVIGEIEVTKTARGMGAILLWCVDHHNVLEQDTATGNFSCPQSGCHTSLVHTSTLYTPGVM